MLALLLVWVGAFFADVAGMLSDEAVYTSSLISAKGVRWALRTALPSIDAVPWGVVMVLVATFPTDTYIVILVIPWLRMITEIAPISACRNRLPPTIDR